MTTYSIAQPSRPLAILFGYLADAFTSRAGVKPKVATAPQPPSVDTACEQPSREQDELRTLYRLAKGSDSLRPALATLLDERARRAACAA